MMRASASGNLAFRVGAIVLVVAAAGVWIWGRALLPQDAAVPVAAVPVPAVSSGETDRAEQPEGVPEDTSEPAGPATAAATEAAGPRPRLDEVRHEADGLLVIAGRVAPFAEVILRLDGSEFARASADGSGGFATVATLAPSGVARVLTLSQLDGSGGEIESGDELILAPVRRPAPVDRLAAQDDRGAAETEPLAVAPLAVEETRSAPTADIAVVEPAVAAPPDATIAAVPATEEAPADTGADMLVAALDRPAEDESQAASAEGADGPDDQDPAPAGPTPLVEVDPTDLPSTSDAAAMAQSAAGQGDIPEPVADTIAAEPLPDESRRQAPVETFAGTDAATDMARDAAGEVSAAVEPAEMRVTAAAPDTTLPTDTLPAVAPPDAGSLVETPAQSASASPIMKQDADTAQADALGSGSSQQMAILRSNEDGVTVVRPIDPQPQVMRQVALDSISYSDVGDVELQGRAQDVARQVRVYLDNRPVASLDVTASGNWRGSLPKVDTGIYTLRIDEVDASGRVTSRVETPFQRESPEVLAAASGRVTTQVRAITVQRGDTLWAISRERYGDGILYVRVFEANRDSIRNPDLIYPGQIFTLPSD